MTSLKRRLHKAASAYKKNKEGTASIEFVLVAPLLIFLYIGLYGTSIAFTVNGSVNRASEVAASFPTFEEDLDNTIMSNIMTATIATLDYPNFDITKAAVKIYSIEQVDDTPASRRLVGKAFYEGSNATGILSDLTATDFQGNLLSLEADDGFIVAEVAYLYTPLISDLYIEQITLTDRKLLNPRENQGQALSIATVIPSTNSSPEVTHERSILSCTPTDGVFSCDFSAALP